MYVKRIFYDDMRNQYDFEKEIELPGWDDVEGLINKMDGKVITQITMDNGNEDHYFCIGGGNGGLYNVFISENDNEMVWNLVNPDNDSKTYRLVTGGQEGEFEGRLCVTIKTVKKVAKYYYEKGEKCNGYMWE
ncbi:MAG: Imm1 family immunity protein [Ruminococcus flavefaciens]|nr:Imm1 family immunity protein [Ruminococcus flavefaciens]